MVSLLLHNNSCTSIQWKWTWRSQVFSSPFFLKIHLVSSIGSSQENPVLRLYFFLIAHGHTIDSERETNALCISLYVRREWNTVSVYPQRVIPKSSIIQSTTVTVHIEVFNQLSKLNMIFFVWFFKQCLESYHTLSLD